MADSGHSIEPEKPRGEPLFAWLQLTSGCNLSCSYCYTESSPQAAGGQLSLEQAQGILEDVKAAGGRGVQLSGGEPTIWPGLAALLDHAERLGLRVALITNGTNIKPALVRQLARTEASVQVSLDAVTPQGYAAARGKNRLPAALRGIDLLLEAGVPVVLSSALTTVNAAWVGDLVEFARQRGIRGVHLAPSYWRDENALGKSLFIKDIYPVLRTLYDLQLDCYLELSIDMVEQLVLPIVLGFERHHYCNSMAGRNVEIAADGQVYACAALRDVPEMKLGDLSGGRRLLDVVSSNRAMGTFPDLGSETVAECRTCEYRTICAGGCRAATHHQTGDLQSRHPHCAGLKRFMGDVRADHAAGRIDDYVDFLGLAANFEETPDAMTKAF
ncbi:radical SAM protein [Streptomyces sp. NPDC017435]|uniref:radical SAM protein n=1 Tax=Streptomyces sp. NPDC017435 TaxID=3364995 RepID=UPI0037B016AC